ncbi:Rof/RNase P-like protein [Syncephalis fuscata]|nr:Rof/RNase P-like protein [Syncephalis fuscata]
MTDSPSFYTSFPKEVERHPAISGEEHEPIPIDPVTQRFVPNFVCEALKEGTQTNAAPTQIYQEKLADRVMPIEGSTQELARKKGRQNHRRTGKLPVLTAKQKRAAGIYKLPTDCNRYALFEPLHTLWTQYINEVYGTNTNPRMFLPKLLKADLHGSIMTVVRSRCPSYIGTTGIVIMETKNMFRIIDCRDRLTSIPKANSVFSLKVKDQDYTIYGSQFCYRAADRAAKKFKGQNTIDL